jgi:hypothetical protein
VSFPGHVSQRRLRVIGRADRPHFRMPDAMSPMLKRA